MIKLIVTDMDGTLLTDDKKLPDDFWETEQKLQRKSITLAIASGRQYYNLIEVFEPIKDRTLFLAENGTFVAHRGKELFCDPLDKTAAHTIVDIARGIPESYIILCGKLAAYIENSDERFLEILFRHYSKVEAVEDLKTVEDTFLKVTLCDFKDSETNSYPHFRHLSERCKVAVSGRNWLDITNAKASKGSALLKIREKLHITDQETLVFGDFLNDYEMMQVSSNSYAMKNAHPEILKVSRFSTDFDNNQNGVTATINHLIS